ncbi:hypothetical protein JL720_12898 [Aureococcus anophagefferens]|nr:hypothetical protein JL720_12898 [Aureococcus anophagefferens]
MRLLWLPLACAHALHEPLSDYLDHRWVAAQVGDDAVLIKVGPADTEPRLAAEIVCRDASPEDADVFADCAAHLQALIDADVGASPSFNAAFFGRVHEGAPQVHVGVGGERGPRVLLEPPAAVSRSDALVLRWRLDEPFEVGADGVVCVVVMAERAGGAAPAKMVTPSRARGALTVFGLRPAAYVVYAQVRDAATGAARGPLTALRHAVATAGPIDRAGEACASDGRKHRLLDMPDACAAPDDPTRTPWLRVGVAGADGRQGAPRAASRRRPGPRLPLRPARRGARRGRSASPSATSTAAPASAAAPTAFAVPLGWDEAPEATSGFPDLDALRRVVAPFETRVGGSLDKPGSRKPSATPRGGGADGPGDRPLHCETGFNAGYSASAALSAGADVMAFDVGHLAAVHVGLDVLRRSFPGQSLELHVGDSCKSLAGSSSSGTGSGARARCGPWSATSSSSTAATTSSPRTAACGCWLARENATVIVDDVNADCETVHRPGLCDGPLLAWRAAAADGPGRRRLRRRGFCVATYAARDASMLASIAERRAVLDELGFE